MAIIRLNGVEVTSPTKYTPKLSTIDSSNSGRNDDGIMTREIVRRKVANIDIGWEKLTNEELTQIVSQLTDEINVEFFYGVWRSAKMYAGDITIDLESIPDGARWSLSFGLVEY